MQSIREKIRSKNQSR